jgi:hypothetical protein
VKGHNWESVPTLALFPKEGEFAQTGINVPEARDSEVNEYPGLFVNHLKKYSTAYQTYCEGNDKCNDHEKKLGDVSFLA